MKKYYILITSIILVLFMLMLLSPQSTPDSDIIVNKLPKSLPMPDLYYSDIKGKKIRSYMLDGNQLRFSKEKFIGFTEGFLSKNKYQFYMNLLQEFARSKDTTLPKYLHDFYEDEDFVIISFSGELQDIYIIEKNNLRIHRLNYKPEQNLGPMYVSHVQRVDNYLILLAGEKEAYNALIYTVYLPTFDVIDAVRFPTHESAISDTHYTITPTGSCVFINGTGIKIYDTLNASYQLINLDFTPTNLINYEDSILVLGEGADTFNYALLDKEFQVVYSGTLTLPAPNSLIVKGNIFEDYLFLVTYDKAYKRYINYLLTYDLKSGELLYSLGIKPYKSYALLDAKFPVLETKSP